MNIVAPAQLWKCAKNGLTYRVLMVDADGVTAHYLNMKDLLAMDSYSWFSPAPDFMKAFTPAMSDACLTVLYRIAAALSAQDLKRIDFAIVPAALMTNEEQSICGRQIQLRLQELSGGSQ